MTVEAETGSARAGTARARTGEWAIVLGASSGMGAAVARRLAADGMSVLGVHLDTASRAEDVDRLADELRATGVRVRFVNANAAAQGTREEVVEALVALRGARVGVLFHSLAFGSLLPFLPETVDDDAGPARAGTDRVLTPRQMTMTLEVMAHSLVWWTRDLVGAGLLGRGSHVLAMTSAGDSRVSTSYGAVSAAKSALLSHVRQLAVEGAPLGIAVNAIRAGVTLTPSFSVIPGSDELAAMALAANPSGRLTTVADVAEAVRTLIATRSHWLTGNVIAADGGEGLTT